MLADEGNRLAGKNKTSITHEKRRDNCNTRETLMTGTMRNTGINTKGTNREEKIQLVRRQGTENGGRILETQDWTKSIRSGMQTK